MKKVKVGVTVCYQNKPDETFVVVKKHKGALTNKPNMHSGILFDGYKRR